MIACAPLHGAHFRADSRRVHQLLKNFLVAETAEQWIKNLEPHANSRRDMLALREHYGGEGNASRHIATAERMSDRIPSTTPGAEPPRDARDSGSARSHSTHLETSSSDRPKMVTYTEPQTVSSYISVKGTRRTLRMPNFTRATHAQPSINNFPWRDSDFWRADPLTRDDPGGTKFSHFPPK